MVAAVFDVDNVTASNEDGAACGAASDESVDGAIGVGDTGGDGGSGTDNGDREREVTVGW